MECQGQMTLAEFGIADARHSMNWWAKWPKAKAGCWPDAGGVSRPSARKIDGDVFFDAFKIVGTPEKPSF